MIVSKHIRLEDIIKYTWKWLLFYLLLSTLLVIGFEEFDFIFLQLPLMPITLLGTALSILLGFRMNAAYERWWEARKVWGSIINDSRNLARQVISYFHRKKLGNVQYNLIRSLVYRQVAFVHALRLHLRKQGRWDVLSKFLSKNEFEKAEVQHNKPLGLLLNQMQQLRIANIEEEIDVFMLIQMDATLNRLCDHLGACERIKHTVFPRPYSYFSYIFVHIFSCLLPFALLAEIGYLTIPLTLLIIFIFNSIEQIAYDIENPFEGRDNDIPMTSLSKLVEIDLKEMLREEVTQEHALAHKGVLM